MCVYIAYSHIASSDDTFTFLVIRYLSNIINCYYIGQIACGVYGVFAFSLMMSRVIKMNANEHYN